jgi:hypothetical protein
MHCGSSWYFCFGWRRRREHTENHPTTKEIKHCMYTNEGWNYGQLEKLLKRQRNAP